MVYDDIIDNLTHIISFLDALKQWLRFKRNGDPTVDSIYGKDPDTAQSRVRQDKKLVTGVPELQLYEGLKRCKRYTLFMMRVM